MTTTNTLSTTTIFPHVTVTSGTASTKIYADTKHRFHILRPSELPFLTSLFLFC